MTLRSRLDDRHVQFDVEDTGVGLSPEDCEKVFEKFYRVQKDQQMAPGTGLGLPLAKYIVEDVHGGRLDAAQPAGRRQHVHRFAPQRGERGVIIGPRRRRRKRYATSIATQLSHVRLTSACGFAV